MKRLTSHRWIRNAIIHPFVFAVYPVVFLYIHNMGKGYVREALVTAVAMLICAALLWMLVSFLVKDKAKAALITSLFFFLFFSYGHATSASATIIERMQLLDKAGFLVEGKSGSFLWLAIWGILLIAVSYLVIRLSSDLSTATNFLNVVALALIVIAGVTLAIRGVNTFLMPRIRASLVQVTAQPDSNRNQADADSADTINDTAAIDDALARDFVGSWRENTSTQSANAISESTPDIYYIILDMYARSDFLEEIYGIDNSDFLSFLTEKGFYVADKSRANYPHTILSLPSSLNFMYLDEVAEQVGTGSTNYWPLVVILKDNRTFQYLRGRGYNIWSFSSGYGISEIKDADVYMTPSGWRPTLFQDMLVESTPLALFWKTQDEIRRELIRYTFDHLPDAAQIDSPTMVFAHISAPHYPLVFGANGERVLSKPKLDYEYDEFIEAYGNQLRFVTKQVQSAIEEILTESSRPPIIILQSDHGPNSAIYGGGGVNIPEKLSILNAYCFPDQNYGSLSEDITPVNTFRVIFNQYFGADFELLENRSFFSSYSESPYLFVDVTDEVVGGEPKSRD